jgi:NHLM bacteriocin system ABC transporter peptidase/ATP-binding protein
MEAVECGAASLAIVLAYYGRWVSLEELRVACGVSRDGSKLSNILKCARCYGLNAKAFKKNDLQAILKLPIPSILHWNFNHLLVFEGVHKGRVYLNDPAYDPRVVSMKELGKSFTGVILTLEPGSKFQPIGRPPSLWKELAARQQDSRKTLAYVTLSSLLLVVPGVLVPVFSKVFVDNILIGQQEDWFRPLCLGMLLMLLLRGLLITFQQRYLLRLETQLATAMSSRFLTHVLRLPMSFFSQRQAGDVANRVAASERIAQLLSGGLATNLFNLISVAFYGLVMLIYDLPLALAGFALASLNWVALRSLSRVRADLNGRLLNDLGKLAGATVGSIHAIETLKASGTCDAAFSRWAGYQSSSLLSQQSLGGQTAWLTALPTLLTALTNAAVLGLGGYRVMNGALTIGDLVAFQALMAGFAAPITRLVALASDLQTVRGLLIRLSDVFRYPLPPQAWKDGPEDPCRLQGLLELRNVSFGYNPLEPPLIDDFSLTLKPGTRVALVGISGSGKSTLGRLMCGLLSPSSGQVLLDGRPLETIPPPLLAATMAYVDQEIFLFEGSLRDNLTLWDDSVSDEMLTEALKDAMILNEVKLRSQDLDCAISEGGLNFSGGERQRLEIARALVNRPTLLLLDEATAALDPATENAIDSHIRRRGAACVIIAHRLSTIRDCNEIIVLKAGKVMERGTHEQLLAANGEYAALVQAL